MDSSISPPHTYSEWVDILELLKNKSDDEAVLSAMLKGSVEWQSGVAERFTKKLIDAINFRLNMASDKFQKEINRAMGQERVIVHALLSLRKDIKFLSEAINLPSIPEKERSQYYQLVIEQADNIQNSLEESAKKDRTGKLLNIVRSNKVNVF